MWHASAIAKQARRAFGNRRLARPRHPWGALFRERQMSLRAGDRVRHIRLRPSAQALLLVAVVGALLWSSLATWMAQSYNTALGRKEVEIQESRVAYDAVLRRIAEWRADLASLTAQSPGAARAAELAAVMERSHALEADLAGLVGDLEAPVGERVQLIASRASLHGRIAGLQSELADARAETAGLENELRRADAAMEIEIGLNETLVADRNSLRGQIAGLERRLSTAENRGARLAADLRDTQSRAGGAERTVAALRAEKAGLARDLDARTAELAAMNAQADSMEARLGYLNRRFLAAAPVDAPVTDARDVSSQVNLVERAGLEVLQSLKQSRFEAQEAQSALAQVMTGLVRVAGYARADHAPDNTPAQALALIAELERLHDTQLDMVNQLNAGALSNINRVESVIATAGLDVNNMLSIAGLADGLGGPLQEEPSTEVVDLEVSPNSLSYMMDALVAEASAAEAPAEGSSLDLALSVSTLQNNVSRWMALEELMRCAPLAPPVDAYRVTSRYGGRTDPITGRRAFHGGLDLGGGYGTPVYAPAPGVVTMAGRSGPYGLVVEIDHGCGIRTRYGHLQAINVKKGEQVDFRTRLGSMGSSGRSTGPHLHYEIHVGDKTRDPEAFIEGGRYVLKS